jgi:hypothetical protein
MITILGNRGCVAVASFLGAPSVYEYIAFINNDRNTRTFDYTPGSEQAVTAQRGWSFITECEVSQEFVFTARK